MVRTALVFASVFLMTLLAQPSPVAAGAAVSHFRQTSVGAQAAFDTAVRGDDGIPVPGTYYSVLLIVSMDTYIVDGESIASSVVYADVTQYRIDTAGEWIMISNLVGWNDAGPVSIDPDLGMATAEATLDMYECGWGDEGPYCTDAGVAAIAVAFSGESPMRYEPQRYTEVWPGPSGYIYTTHRTATLRAATAVATMDGVALGTSVSGNFFRVHGGETFVGRG